MHKIFTFIVGVRENDFVHDGDGVGDGGGGGDSDGEGDGDTDGDTDTYGDNYGDTDGDGDGDGDGDTDTDTDGELVRWWWWDGDGEMVMEMVMVIVMVIVMVMVMAMAIAATAGIHQIYPGSGILRIAVPTPNGLCIRLPCCFFIFQLPPRRLELHLNKWLVWGIRSSKRQGFVNIVKVMVPMAVGTRWFPWIQPCFGK